METPSLRRRIEIQGAVQGVGFRPFVYRIAQIAGVHGYVLNTSAGVVIEAEGDQPSVDRFFRALQDELPPLARIDEIRITEMEIAQAARNGEPGFAIRESLETEGRFAFVPPDAATCSDCLRELTTPSDRRYHYPFINCTNCGPRYTIIRDVPYDRAKTTMAPFRMCAACQVGVRGSGQSPLSRRAQCMSGLRTSFGAALNGGAGSGRCSRLRLRSRKR